MRGLYISLEIFMIKVFGFACLFYKEWCRPRTAPRRVQVVRTIMAGGGDEAEYLLLPSLPPSPPSQELASATHQAECSTKSSLVGAVGVFGGVGRLQWG